SLRVTLAAVASLAGIACIVTGALTFWWCRLDWQSHRTGGYQSCSKRYTCSHSFPSAPIRAKHTACLLSKAFHHVAICVADEKAKRTQRLQTSNRHVRQL